MRFGNVKGLASFSLFAMEGCVLAISDFVSKVEGSVRPRHLGLGFVWAWIYCSFSTSALFAGRAGSSINADSSWFASAVAVVGCFFVFALAWRRVDMSRIRPAAFVGAVLMAAGTFFLGAFDLPAWAGTLCGVSSGIGSGLLVLFWGDAYSRLETERVEIAVPAASGVMLACAFVFPYIQGLPGACGVSSLPILSMVCLYLTWNDIDAGRFVERPSEGETWRAGEHAGLRTSAAHTLDASRKDTRGMRSLGMSPSAMRDRSNGSSQAPQGKALAFLVRISVVLFAAYMAIGVASATGGATDAFQAAYGFDAATMLGSVCGVCLAFWFIFFSPRVNVPALLRWVAPLIMIGLAAIPFSGMAPEFVASATMSVADTVLQIIAFLSLVNLARAGVFLPAFAIGVGQGMIQLGVLVGNLAGKWSALAATSSGYGLWETSLVVICVFSIAMALAPSDRNMGGIGLRYAGDLDDADPMGAGELSVSQGGSAASGRALHAFEAEGNGLLTQEENLDGMVARIAVEGGLSARETEVLGYLARGRSQPYIRDALVLSKNTVASHVKHIYQKLNVHSRQELLDLFAD